MPVVTTSSEFLLRFDDLRCERQWLCSRLLLVLLLITTLVLGLFLRHQAVRRRLVRRRAFATHAGAERTWTVGTALSRLITNLSSDPGYRVKQGQGPLEKRATLSVSRGGATATAPVGLSGVLEERTMEEDRSASTTSMSRGVSTEWRDQAKLSGPGGLPSPDQLLAPAEGSGHVRTSQVDAAADLRKHHHTGEPAVVSAGLSCRVNPGGPRLGLTSFLGHHMMDDEHILYRARDSSPANASMGKWSSSARRPDVAFSRSAPAPSPRAAGTSQGLAALGEYAKTMAIPFRAPRNGKDHHLYAAEDTVSPSSYPPASPLLPPPPATTYEAFDPAAVMFPGPARDGGIRIVPMSNHGAGEHQTQDHAQELDRLGDAGISWNRHTRVYGGGVCLACAAAAGEEGGYYGDSVRPQDRR